MFKLNVCLTLRRFLIKLNIMNEKQQEILNAAEKLFEEKGFDGTSVRDIAKEANVNLAMISYYFGSKDKLLEALFETRLDNFRINYELIFDKDFTAFESLEKLVHVYVKTMNQNAGVYKILSVEGGIKKRLINSDSFTKIKKFNLELVSKVLQKGIDAGVFNKTVSPVLLHSTMMGTFMNFQMNRSFLQNVLEITSDEAYNQYIENQLANHIHRTIKALLIYED